MNKTPKRDKSLLFFSQKKLKKWYRAPPPSRIVQAINLTMSRQTPHLKEFYFLIDTKEMICFL